MKFRTIVIAILIYLLAATLFSCGPRLTPQEKRDKKNIKKLAEIEAESPNLFKIKIDTVLEATEITKGEVKPEMDTTAFDSLLNQYSDLSEAYRAYHDRLEETSINLENSIHEKRFLAQQLIEVRKKLRQGAMKSFPVVEPGKFNLMFDYKDGKMTWSGEFFNKTIHHYKALPPKIIKQEITMGQAFWKLWPIWAIIVLLGIVVGVIKYLTR